MAKSSNLPLRTTAAYHRWLWWMNLGKKLGCHQLHDRSLMIRGYQLPLCARCTGIVLGIFPLAPLLWVLGFSSLPWSIVMLLPLMVDGSLQYLGFWTSTNSRRLFTGFLFGAGSVLILPSLFTLLF